ncbi:FAD-dependent monooxygenase, partial [bacterium]|nr:FAD-dependent monooxygenase [bacterium]
MSDKIILIGAGLAGSLLSVYLAKKGYQVELFERRPDMRKTNIGAGRSINLALSTRGIHALKEVGLYEEIMKIAIPMKGRMIHSHSGDLQFLPYGKNDSEVINAVSRGDLNMRLMDLAEQNQNVKIHFNERCTGMNFSTGEVHLTNEVSNVSHIEKGRTVIGTDGSASAIRMDMLKIGRFNFSQSYLEHGYKELTIPAGDNGKFLLEKKALHIWPRKTYMLIALPNIDGSFT